jgi:hypothetical protein
MKRQNTKLKCPKRSTLVGTDVESLDNRSAQVSSNTSVGTKLPSSSKDKAQRIRNFSQVARGYDGGLAVQHGADGKGVMPPDKDSQIGCGIGAARLALDVTSPA